MFRNFCCYAFSLTFVDSVSFTCTQLLCLQVEANTIREIGIAELAEQTIVTHVK